MSGVQVLKCLICADGDRPGQAPITGSQFEQ